MESWDGQRGPEASVSLATAVLTIVAQGLYGRPASQQIW